MEASPWTFRKIVSFKRLFQFYWEKVFDHCFYYSKDYNTAKDLTQNIFLDLWERGAEFPDRENLERYLTRCAKYQVLNYFRYRNTTERRAPEEMPEVSTYRYNPEYQLQFKQLAEYLDRSIESLHEPCRTVFCLSRREALSHKAIATQLGITVSTVEYHIGNALRFLKKELAAYQG